jgi:hypothetical protein
VISRFRAILEQEMRIRQSPQNEALLRMAEGIFDFIGEDQPNLRVRLRQKL